MDVELPVEHRRIIDRPGFQLAMGSVPENEGERPPEQLVRGRCPECGEEIVPNLYWHDDKGYILLYQCWEALQPDGIAKCNWYAVP